MILPHSLPPELLESKIDAKHLNHESREASRIMEALDQAGGNRAKAARILGISRATLYRRMSSLAIDTEASRV